MSPSIQALFLDIGGVLLTNGWTRDSRKKAAETFGLDYAEMDERHYLTYDTYESGKISLSTYLDRTVFFKPRSFTKEDFTKFMYAQSKPHLDMIEYCKALKAAHRLKVGVISNEGRELSEYRIRTFDLGSFVDFFVSSAFVHLRKPDEDIFRLALDMMQVNLSACVYVDDRPLFVEVARKLGMTSLHHETLEGTRRALDSLGLSLK
ncbi:MAG TPA: HAD-IA family hydrolase [bacterium]|jgi:putative hydrolase of the HAD superfamily|nr:HAD-IA family hydrolase [bacterium]